MGDLIGPWRRSAEKQGYSRRFATVAAVFAFTVVLGTAVAGFALGTALLGGVHQDAYPWSWRLPGAVIAFAFGAGAAVVVVKGPDAIGVSGKTQASIYAVGYLGALLPLIGFMIAEEPGGLWALVLWIALFAAALVSTRSGGRQAAAQKPLDSHSAAADPWAKRKAVLYLASIVGLALVLIGFAAWQLSRNALLNAAVIASFAVSQIGIGVFAYLRTER